jgi:hypothetical protein
MNPTQTSSIQEKFPFDDFYHEILVLETCILLGAFPKYFHNRANYQYS